MRELLEPRSNLENRSNHKPVQPHVCEEILFLIWNSSMDLKWEKKIIKRENDEEDPKMKQKKKKKKKEAPMVWWDLKKKEEEE